MVNRHIDSIMALGQEVSVLADGGYVKIPLPTTTSIYPYLIAKYTPSTNCKSEYYELIHTTRRNLAQIDPSMEEDILWYNYKEFLYDLFNSIDRNTFKPEPINITDIPLLVKKLFDYDKAIVKELIAKYENVRKYTKQI